MPSASPTSRRSSSSVPSRPSRADLLAPRGLQQSFHTTTSNSAASRALYENIDDHKENSSENVNSRGAPGRSNQNLKGASKKPWVTHFAKPATTLSPSNRILVDRNSTCSPVRLGSIASGNGETLSDKNVAKATTPREREEASTTPGPVKGVAELSKRIQQFLEDQDVLLGAKTGSSHEVTSACPSVTPVEPGQRPLSSPYNPYKSPFFERPKFLRLNGNVSPMEGADIVAPSTDGIGMLMEPTTEEELPLFEGDQVLVTPLQQIQFSTSLSPSSTDDEEVTLAENAKELILGAITDEEAAVDAIEAKVQPILEGEVNILHELKAEVSKERTGKTPEKDDVTRTVQVQNQRQDGEVNVADLQVKSDIAVNSTPQEGFQVFQDKDQNLSVESAKTEHDVQVKVNSTPQEGFHVLQDEDQNVSQVVDTVDGDDVSWGKKAVRVMFCGALLATFLALVLLSSASPGLLPPSLVHNPVNSFWQSSKYYEHSMMLVRGMQGLWSTEMIHFPADARVAVVRGVELFQVISKLSNQAHQELQLYVQVASSTLDDWGRVLVQQISLSMNPDTAGEHEDRARQFEWIQDYEFEEEWIDEIPKLAYTDWELLHEYDLGAANQFVLRSIPESLKNDLRRNFSRLSDSPEVRDLLEDLMKLKGGSTEEDRLEVLQYFWEYRRFSASAHESLMKFQFETTAVEDSSKIQGFSIHSEHQDMESDSEDAEMGQDQGQETMASKEHIEEKNYQTPTEEHSELFDDAHLNVRLAEHRLEKVGIEQEQTVPELRGTASEQLQELMVLVSTVYEDVQLDEQHLDELAEHRPEKVGIEQEQIVPKMASKNLQASMVYEDFQTLLSTVYEKWTDSVQELQREVGNVDTSSTDVQPIQSTSDVKLDIAQVATLATFMVVSFFILGRNRQPKSVTKVVSHASSVQFLRKFDQPPNSLDDEMQQKRPPFADVKQDKKQVTMIEELNDRFASVLQSPEPNNLHLRSPNARKDEDLIRSPILTSSASSPFGSFTTYKLMPKKEGQAMETKLTPVRRSSRIRNHVSMSPNANGARRIAISPP